MMKLVASVASSCHSLISKDDDDEGDKLISKAGKMNWRKKSKVWKDGKNK